MAFNTDMVMYNHEWKPPKSEGKFLDYDVDIEPHCRVPLDKAVDEAASIAAQEIWAPQLNSEIEPDARED